MENLKYQLMDELKGFENRELTAGSLDTLYKISSILKNLCKIEMYEQESSNDGYSGRHYVRGHYSRDGSYDGTSNRGYSRDGYSRDEAKDYIVQQVEEMMERVHDPRDRETLKRIMQQMK